ncbi:NAD-dependent epimerase/dehydratase family protein [Catenuloplanes atrovinosus]|uniref:Nucleoside-diphosphate-sugar epimerase n=1 Tax=Catenuloplanes atrovinosus TaxID=137266 RepID=A0AAE4CAE3_9ACTN|nr:NAD-dependent epimerase/dehydratase family protein [Catenuloplanes atrovinosus]MDR7276852.1 nucleoside-diphosphate-sugar epimerase [Catenuloplanes atrovinosus]
MRVVVTGASGNIGSAVVAWLTARPEVRDVVGIARRVPPDDPHGIGWRAVDVGAPGAAGALAEAFTGADAVVHLAWHIVAGHDRPAQERTNLAGSANVLTAVARARVPHLVHLSSAAVYSRADPGVRVTEDWPRRGVPGSTYSQDKVAVEDLLDRLGADLPELRVARIRPLAVIQPAAAADLARLALGNSAPLAHRIGRLPLLPLPAQTVTQVSAAQDVADVVGRALLARATGAFNVTDEPAMSAAVLARLMGGRHVPISRPLLRRLLGVTWRLRLHPLDPSWADLLIDSPLLDCTRARTELGWHPHHDGRLTLLATRRAVTTATPRQAGYSKVP